MCIRDRLKNQTGSGNYAAMFFGNDKNSNGFPTQYWLLNPANLSGQMKSVITNSVNESAPYNTCLLYTSYQRR